MTTAYSSLLQRITGATVLLIVGALCLFSLYQPEKRIEPQIQTQIQAVPKVSPVVAQVEVPPLPEPQIPAEPKVQVASKVPAEPKVTSKAISKAPEVQWWVQLATFIQKENAQQLVNRLQRDGQAAEVNRTTKFYRVLIGPVGTKQQALALNQQLAQRYTMQGMVIRRKSP
jgi:cell division septation protein DedD